MLEESLYWTERIAVLYVVPASDGAARRARPDV
jgi:hypothetical protein